MGEGRQVATAPPDSGYELKDTEAAVGDAQVPQVDAQVVRRQVRLTVGVDGDGVDVVGVGVGKHPPRAHLDHQVHGHQHGHLAPDHRGGAAQTGALKGSCPGQCKLS